MDKSICFAYFGDGKFLGWYADSFGSIRDSPKVYPNSERQLEIISSNFRNKVNKIKGVQEEDFGSTVVKVMEPLNEGGAKLLSLGMHSDRKILSQYENIELRVVECPEYDGVNPDFDKAAYEILVNQRFNKLVAFLAENDIAYEDGPSAERTRLVGEFSLQNPHPSCDNWIYADYNKVKEWAANEPKEFLQTINI